MTTPDDADMTAAELALGVLDGDERAAAMRRVLADPAFAREVALWREHFAALFAELPDAAPDPSVEARVMEALSGGHPTARRWAWAALAASVAAACLLLVIISRPVRTVTPRAPQVTTSVPPLVAVLTPQKGTPFSAVYDRARHEVRFAEPISVPAGKTAQLWSIGPDAVPHSLGLLSSRGGSRVVLGSRSAKLPAGVTLAISVEPQGGSPTGLPTGPVIATGKLASV